MSDIKNEVLLEAEQTTKKVSKNWKIYASVLGIMVIGAGTGLGVYYGVNANHHSLTKINLSKLNLDIVISKAGITNANQAFEAFLKANTNLSNLNNYLQYDFSSFIAPTETTNGSLTINAKADGKYTGTITVSFVNIIDENNFESIVWDLSKKEILILQIPSGTTKGDGTDKSTYAQALKKSFIKLVTTLGYKLKLKDIVIDKQWMGNNGEAPNDEQLASDYYDWHTTNGITIEGYVVTNNDQQIRIAFSKLQCEIIIGEKK